MVGADGWPNRLGLAESAGGAPAGGAPAGVVEPRPPLKRDGFVGVA